MRFSRAALLLFALIAAAAPSVQATPTINVGNISLLPETDNQIVTLVVSGGDSVTGFDLRAQINDGKGPNPEPVFKAVGFSGGTIWDAHPVTPTGGPVVQFPQDAQASVVFNLTGDAVSATGNLVNLTISTVGFDSGTFPLMLASTDDIRADSAFIGIGGLTIPASITNGTLTITPEPASPVLLGAIVGLWPRRRWRR